MNADGLLAIYDRAVDTPDVTARLRRFVLDLATRGKLVEQDPNDEPASALLERITAEKAKLTGKGKVSVASVTDPDSGHHLPFSLPAGWAKTTIGGICSKTGSGSTPRGGKQAYKESGIVFLRSQNIHNDGLRLTDVAYISPATHKRMSGTAVKPSDLLLNITGGSIGRCCLVPDDLDQANVSQHVSIIRIAVDVSQRFLHYVILAPYFQAFIFDEQTGAGRGGLPKYKMDRIPVALPPLAEQQRIVARIGELMAICDDLEEVRVVRKETRSQLTKTALARLSGPDADAATFRSHARFAIDALSALTSRADQVKNLRQTILELAVRGKLVKRNPADEPAAELLKRVASEKTRLVKAGSFREPRNAKKINRGDLPLTPPEHWAWVRLIDVARTSYGFAFKSSQFNSEKRGMPLIRIRDISTTDTQAYFGGDYDSAYVVQAGDYLVGMDGDFNLRRWRGKDGLLNQRVMRINGWRCGVNPEFVKIPLQMVLNHLHGDTSLTTVKHLSAKQVNGIEIPLPPLPEQHRIVAKVDQLMTLCDQLEASLSTVNVTRSCLLESVLYESLRDTA